MTEPDRTHLELRVDPVEQERITAKGCLFAVLVLIWAWLVYGVAGLVIETVIRR